MEHETDLLVVGSGLAGLYAALVAAQHGRVTLVTRGRLEDSNSCWAQGGIAAAVAPDDDPELHAEDTLRAGRGLCDPDAVAVLAAEGPARIADLARLGVRFDARPDGRPDLGLEAGHTRRRILHAGGVATGRAVVQALVQLVRHSAAICVWEGMRASALLSDGQRCYGARFRSAEGGVTIRARATILATGGAAGLFARTTNPPTASGDGIALAFEAGAAVADLEFVQFHPTALAHGSAALLLSEALRGEGAQLINGRGERFMHRYDPAGELAPRDVVARAVARELQSTGAVFLSMEHFPARSWRRFAPILKALRAAGIDPRRQPVPVAPAAHFLMGGVWVDLDGRSSLPGLYACGEVACTGVHGANRLASNSLLECLVFAHRAALAATSDPPPPSGPSRAALDAADLPFLGEAERELLGRLLMAGAGMVRTAEGLQRLERSLGQLPLALETRVAGLMAAAMAHRCESRGAHWREDFPAEDPALAGRFVWQKGMPPRLVPVAGRAVQGVGA